MGNAPRGPRTAPRIIIIPNSRSAGSRRAGPDRRHGMISPPSDRATKTAHRRADLRSPPAPHRTAAHRPQPKPLLPSHPPTPIPLENRGPSKQGRSKHGPGPPHPHLRAMGAAAPSGAGAGAVRVHRSARPPPPPPPPPQLAVAAAPTGFERARCEGGGCESISERRSGDVLVSTCY